MQATSYRNILKATSLFTGVQGLSILLNIVRGKLASVLLGPAGIGLNSIFNELRELIHETTNLGLDKSGVREISRAYQSCIDNNENTENSEAIRTAIRLTRSWILILALVGTLLTVLLAEPLSLLFFGDSTRIWDFVLLSPAIGLSTISCGELVVLRGIQRLKTIALVSLLHVVAGIVTTIPIYYFWGIRGVVPALVLLTLMMSLIGIVYSYRIYRPEFCFQRKFLKGGNTMLVIGLSFALSGIVSRISRLAVQGYLNNEASLETVGFYAQILSLMAYSSILFASIDTDYFPRLSGVFSNLQNRCETVRRQIAVTMAVTLPVMMCGLFSLPIIIPLLMSSKFIAIIPAAQILLASMIFKALYLPTSYMPLSAGDSKTYLFMESISYLCFIPAVLVGYEMYGLLGIGIGLAVSNFFDVVCALLCARIKYQFHLDRTTLVKFLLQSVVAFLGYLAASHTEGWTYWTLGCLIVLSSTLICYTDIRAKMRNEK